MRPLANWCHRCGRLHAIATPSASWRRMITALWTGRPLRRGVDGFETPNRVACFWHFGMKLLQRLDSLAIYLSHQARAAPAGGAETRGAAAGAFSLEQFAWRPETFAASFFAKGVHFLPLLSPRSSALSPPLLRSLRYLSASLRLLFLFAFAPSPPLQHAGVPAALLPRRSIRQHLRRRTLRRQDTRHVPVRCG